MYSIQSPGSKDPSRILLIGCIILGFLTHFNSVNAQSARLIDSVKTASGDKAIQVDGLTDVALKVASRDYNMSLDLVSEAHSIASSIQDTARIIRSGRIKGQLLRRLDRLDESISVLTELVPLATADGLEEDYASLLSSLANTLTFKAEYDKALDYHFKVLIIREDKNDKVNMAITHNNIGLVYYKLRNYDRALEYYNLSLKLKNEIEDTYDLDRLHINIGLCHIYLKNYEEALRSIKEGIKVCGQDCSDEKRIEAEHGLGVAYFGLDNMSDAKANFLSSLEISNRSGNKRFQAENLVYLARITMQARNYSEAERYLLQAEPIVSVPGYNQVRMDLYREFSNLYNAAENFQKASLYQNKYIALKDSIISEDLVKNIARIQTQFEERTNIATIAAKEEALTRQRMLNIAIGIIALLAGLLVFVLYRNNKAIQRVNAKLEKANQVIEDQNRELQTHADSLQREVNKATADLQVVNESLRKVNEELDNFIYKTSHDIRGPLASLKGMCNVALMDVKDPLALDYLAKLDITATNLNRILTRLLIINQINHATISPETIEINSIVQDIILLETKKGIPQRLNFKTDVEKNLSIHSDDALIRIILENLIDNAVKFYNDSSRVDPFVHIKAWSENGSIQIHVIDNGLGITEVDPDKIFQMFSRASERSATGGLGLYLIKQATTRLGGEVGVTKNEEGHTVFMVSLPSEISEEQPVTRQV